MNVGYSLIIQIQSESVSSEVFSACLQSELLKAFLHCLRRCIEAVPRLTVISSVLVNKLQERAETRLLQHPHQIYIREYNSTHCFDERKCMAWRCS